MRSILCLCAVPCVPCAATHAAEALLADKTLVVWATPANLTQRGGSALTIDDQRSHFDGIVFGEIAVARWMAGSDYFRRTPQAQDAWPAETADANTPVQIAIAYHGTETTIYRNGKEYARHPIGEPQAFPKDSAVVIGLRHLEAADGVCFAGTIDDARIYGVALTAEQIAALKPNQPSDPKPLAWWNFRTGKTEDVMGVFAPARLAGNARIVDGRLVLDGKGSYLVTPPSAVARPPVPAPPNPAFLPVYHFTSPTGRDCYPFDPNGAVFHRGRYHLGYIYQDEGKHFWGHASSPDLIHWQVHPPMLSPGPEAGIFSGNAFVAKDGRVVLSYHGLGNEAAHHPAGNCLAVAQDDDLNVFRKLDANPVMKDPGWDPHTWLDGSTYYSISGGNPPSLYRADGDDLTRWTLLGKLLTHDLPGVDADEDISCPDLFRLGEKDILLCISHKRGARYYVGRFENNQFRPEAHYRMNWPGGTFFAPETLVDAKGRRILWAWVLGSPATMSLPRVLSMGADGVLGIEPAAELAALRTNAQSFHDLDIPADGAVVAEGVHGDCKELQITIDPGQAAQCGVKVRCSPDGAEETAIVYDPARRVLRLEMDKSSLDRSVRPRTYAMTFMLPKGSESPEVSAQEAPFELKPGELLNLRIYLDHSIMEVFANGRQCVTQRLWPTRADSVGVAFLARGGSARVKSLDAWDMAPIRLAPLTPPAVAP